jgi:Flp pilus assembly protein TadG
MKHLATDRTERGQAIVLMVLVFIALLGFVGLAVDGGRLYLERRSAQNAADNAALAGAWALCKGTNVNTAATNSSVANGFDPASASIDILIANPPTSGPNSGDDDFVSVVITSRPTLSFARLVFRGTAETQARAVAECRQAGGPVGGGNGLIALAADQYGSFNASGSGSIEVQNGGILIDSNNGNAFIVSGGGNGPNGAARVSASWISVVGGSNVPAWVNVSPAPSNGAAAISDPLLGLQPPAQPGGTCTTVNVGHLPSPPMVINPGYYCSIRVASDGGLRMNPGNYYVNSGFAVTDAAFLQASGVFIYVRSGAVDIAGSGTVTISAPTSGDYAGMAFFMDRSNTSNFSVSGAGIIQVSGTIYAPSSSVVVSGSGTSTTFTSQFIAKNYDVSGAGLMRIVYNEESVYQGGGGGNTFIQLAE